MNVKLLRNTFVAVVLLAGAPVHAQDLPNHGELKKILTDVVKEKNGGFGLNMWATVVDRDGVVKAVQQALLEHELIKVKLRRPPDKKAMAEELAQRSGAALCGLVGHVAMLYRSHPEEPRLKLPQRDEVTDETEG